MSLVKSKQRVADHGEVFTPDWMVDRMLSLVEAETERVDSRFLEPACGNGNFLAKVLLLKLAAIRKRYKGSQFDFERNGVLAVCSIYGIDILQDNAEACRSRLLGVFEKTYREAFRAKVKQKCIDSVSFVLELNIIQGNACTMQTVGEVAEPIVFSEWSPLNGSLLKRRDFSFQELVPDDAKKGRTVLSDQGEQTFMPVPVRDYAPVHFLELADGR